MKFSITIPAYKARYLNEAIQSVVTQTYKEWELIIVDDCSPEPLRNIVKPYLADKRITYYRNEKNIGAERLVENWNKCLGYCKGDFIICMGDDDRLLPQCLEEYCRVIKQYPALDVYHSQTEIIDEEGHIVNRLEVRPEWEDAVSMIIERWNGRKQFVGDFCYRKERLMACGGFYNIPYAWGSDDITAFRAAFTAGIANARKTGFQYRENQQSISLTHNDDKKVWAVLLQKKWYESALTENCPLEQRQAATSSMNAFITRQLSHHILRDMRHRGFGSFLYWFRKIPEHGVSPLTLTKLYIKTMFIRD